MRTQLNPDRVSYERHLYPIVSPDEDPANPSEIVRFAGFPFCRTQTGQWALVDDSGDSD